MFASHLCSINSPKCSVPSVCMEAKYIGSKCLSIFSQYICVGWGVAVEVAGRICQGGKWWGNRGGCGGTNA